LGTLISVADAAAKQSNPATKDRGEAALDANEEEEEASARQRQNL
jgi:hypothetical protein